MSEILDDFESPNHIKERHGCVTTWLVFALIANGLVALIYFAVSIGSVSLPSEYELAVSSPILIGLGILGIIKVISLVMIWQWQKMGFYGLVATSILAVALGLAIDGDASGIGSGFIGIAIFYAILQAKENGVSAWDNLE